MHPAAKQAITRHRASTSIR